MNQIYADGRQVAIDEQYLSKFKIKYERRELETGDYIVNGDQKIIFELKTPGDLLGSVKSGRLFEQIQKMNLQDGYRQYIIITTDNLYKDLIATRSKYADATFWGTIHSLLFSWNIPVIILSKNEFFGKILSKFNENKSKSHREATLHLNKYHRKIKDLILMSLTAIPGIGTATSIKLLDTYGCIHDIAEASIEDLQKKAGLSEKQAKNVYSFYNTYVSKH
jgi:ERCC4-type nuclease